MDFVREGGRSVRVCQFDPAAWDPIGNAKRMAEIVRQSRAEGVGLVVFPMDAIDAGCADEGHLHEDFKAADRIIIESSEGIGVVFAPAAKFSLMLAEDGAEVPTTSLACGCECAESRHLGRKVALIGALADDELGDIRDELRGRGTADVFAVVGSEHFERGQAKVMADALRRLSEDCAATVCYANRIGVSDEGKSVWTYRGDSAIYERGKCVALARRFEEDALTWVPGGAAEGIKAGFGDEGAGDVAEVLRFGLRRFMDKVGVRRVVIGVSGGIDSAVSTALYGSILPPEDILLVSMPGPFTSGTTKSLAHSLAHNLGARFAEIPIGESVDLTKRQFAELITEGPNGAMAGAWSLSPSVIENVQARDRGSRILAAAAAVFGGVFSCNANKDECTIGYGTMYGDISGWLCCLGDLWKGDVYAVGRYLNDEVFHREVIPEGIFKVKPSAELSEKQAVEKGLGDPLVYPYHDKLFKAWVEEGKTPYECLMAYASGSLAKDIGYDGDLGELFPKPADFVADIEKWWQAYRGLAVAKRMQAAPIMAVTSFPFSYETASQGRVNFGEAYRALREKLLA